MPVLDRGGREHLAGPHTGLETHITDITALVEAEEVHDVVLVAHSYAGAPVTGAADRLGDRVAHVVYVDSCPPPGGAAFVELFPPQERERTAALVGDGRHLPPLPFDPAADPVNLAGLDEAQLARLRRLATPHPYATMTQPLRLSGKPLPPCTLIACSIPPEQVQAMIEEGNPFFAGLADAAVIALPTGHYPMLSEPARLAALLASAVA
ncbi:alpha/beta hydrolase [Streptomyces sp. DG2A-72]|uniref:alpha/beta fold hydrolase n=1 Tax=Streptomyces sp. DG2A-72 TaxID=3051386 RepID=UPI00265C7EB9|nr:alpha/beta hydrolase [Streptomyces sp. DG2A-72]MDO0932280.1 alpha/beta hydrolase [Streptomyces sp. DG2A-72]